MLKGLVAALALATAFSGSARSEGIDDTKLIDLWASQKAMCKEGDERDPDTWLACGRSEAFAAVLAGRGFCLDEGQKVWRIGTQGQPLPSEEHQWSCSLITS